MSLTALERKLMAQTIVSAIHGQDLIVTREAFDAFARTQYPNITQEGIDALWQAHLLSIY